MSGIMSMLLGAVSSVAVAVDEFFNRVTLLLPGNGTNGAQNNTFLDSSTNNFTITRNGNTTQGTFSPFSQTGWSNYFDGTGDYLSCPSSSLLAFGTGSFCVEFWLYRTGTTGGIFSNSVNSGGGDAQFEIALNGTNKVVLIGWNTTFITGATTINANTWYHIAVVRSGSSMAIFVNGTRDATATSSNNFSSTNAFIIGAQAGGVGTTLGYISNLRAVKGSAIYNPADSTITVPTSPLTTTSQGATATEVELLTCQSNRFIDNSSNTFTITVNGNTSVQPFSPFAPTAAYSAATVGGSGYFDGTGDYLASATSTDLQLGSSDFSLEWWEYRTAANNVDTAIVCGDGTFSALLGYYNSGAVRFYLSTTGSSWNVFSDTSAGTTASNSWNHFVLTRSGTAFRVFLNGVLGAYATGSGSVTQTTNQIFISGGINGSSAPMEGYISGVRFVKGSIPTSYQTSSTTTNTSIFTPPTAPVTTTSQGATSGDVKYLVNFTNAGITDATAKNDLETVGNAQISTTQSKFGGSSMYFDGTGDQLIFPNSENFNIIRGNFTVECWVYLTGSSGSIVNYTNGQTNNTNFAFELYQISSSTIYMSIFEGSTQYLASSTAFALNTWVHLAGVRNGNTLTVYVNGTAGSTTANVTGVVGNNPGSSTLKVSGYNNATNMITGYVDDLRITKGLARYTANFTAPTTAFPLQ